MKYLVLFLLSLMLFPLTSFTQVVNSISIFPAQPTVNDSVLIISDFSYQGSCSFGLVYIYTEINDSIIELHPTYCGYYDSSSCNSIDTFKIGKFSDGNYKLKIIYHQGSVCPISNFDAVIGQFDSAITIGIVGIPDNQITNSSLKLFPNPTSGKIFISSENDEIKDVKIFNIYGEKVKDFFFSEGQKSAEIDVSKLPKGLYIVQFSDEYQVHYKNVVIQ